MRIERYWSRDLQADWVIVVQAQACASL
jgi:hypothetical protein